MQKMTNPKKQYMNVNKQEKHRYVKLVKIDKGQQQIISDRKRTGQEGTEDIRNLKRKVGELES